MKWITSVIFVCASLYLQDQPPHLHLKKVFRSESVLTTKININLSQYSFCRYELSIL